MYKKIIVFLAFIAICSGAQALTVNTSTFVKFGDIPNTLVCPQQQGQNRSPEITITDIPRQAQSLLLLMHDPDAPHLAGFVHWVVYFDNMQHTALPVNAASLPEQGIVFGLNGLGKPAYFGPCPPKGSGVHRYNLTVYALDKKLDTKTVTQSDQAALLKQIRGHVIAQSVITGFYENERDS